MKKMKIKLYFMLTHLENHEKLLLNQLEQRNNGEKKVLRFDKSKTMNN